MKQTQINLYSFDELKQEVSDEYLIEMFKTYKISFLSDGYLYNGY